MSRTILSDRGVDDTASDRPECFEAAKSYDGVIVISVNESGSQRMCAE